MGTVTGWDIAGVLATIGAAVFTAIAVGALVWIEVWRPRREAPRLRLRERHDLAVTQTLEGLNMLGEHVMVPGPYTLMVRLLVENVEGQLPAEDAQVFLREYEPAMPHPADAEIRSGVQRLRIPLQWTHAVDGPNTVVLHGGHPRYVDLMAVSANYPDTLMLQLVPRPIGGVAELVVPVKGEASTCRLTLDLVAKGAEPESYLVTLTYDGGWEGKEPEANLQLDIRQAPG